MRFIHRIFGQCKRENGLSFYLVIGGEIQKRQRRAGTLAGFTLGASAFIDKGDEKTKSVLRHSNASVRAGVKARRTATAVIVFW